MADTPDPLLPPGPEALAAWCDAQAALLGLPLEPEGRAGVLHYLGIAARMADCVFAVPLSVHAEPGSVFRPVPPERDA